MYLNQDSKNNEKSVSSDTLQGCLRIKKLLTEENWTWKFEKEIWECKNKFYYWDNEAWNYNINSNPSNERCQKIMKWYEDEYWWTPRFWISTIEPVICSARY